MTMADLRGVGADTGVVSGQAGGPRSDGPRRRSFSAEYKLAILEEYEAAEPGAKGALLRREGLYNSHIVEWRKARAAGALAGLTSRTRTSARSPQEVEIERLRRRAERAEAELAKTKAALEVVGKAHALLELLSESAEPKPPSSR
jgi:transposase-like protein